jgi:hypothetical protein
MGLGISAMNFPGFPVLLLVVVVVIIVMTLCSPCHGHMMISGCYRDQCLDLLNLTVTSFKFKLDLGARRHIRARSIRMPRRRIAKGRESDSKSKSKSFHKSDGKLKKWDTISDIPMDEEDQCLS